MYDVIELHTTDRQTFHQCRQKWQFASYMGMGLQPIRTSMNYYDFGTGFHAAIAEYYDRGRQADIARGAWYNYLGTLPYDVDDEIVDLGVGMIMHFTPWALMQDKFTWLGSELESKIEIGSLNRPVGPYPKGTPIVYSYRLDGLVEKDGLFYIVERKTAAKWASSYDYLWTDTQAGSYLWAEQMKRGIKIEGVIYDIHRKAVPKPLRVLKDGKYSTAVDQDTTYDIAHKALTGKHGIIPNEYMGLMQALETKEEHEGDAFFKRQIIRRNQQEIKLIGEMIFTELADMMRGNIYRSDSAMNCNGCQFFDPCVMKWEGNIRGMEQTLEARYEPRKVKVDA